MSPSLDPPRYVRLAELARGGLGTVELVVRRDGPFERIYAMKRPHPHLVPMSETRELFLKEAKMAGLLRHANVVPVVDVGEDVRGPFLLMDYVEGISLSNVVKEFRKRNALIPASIVMQIGQQCADGLRAAHELIAHDGRKTPMVHRDVSPQNILIGFDGVVQLADFGIAKMLSPDATMTNALRGKCGYMSPEQLRFETVDTRSDLFSLGVVLYEALTTERLFGGRGMEKAARRIIYEETPDITEQRGDLSEDVVKFLSQMLAKDPEHRVPSAKHASSKLQAIHHAIYQDDWVELGDWINDEFEDQRDELRSWRAQAMRAIDLEDEMDATVIEATRDEPRSPRRIVWLGIAIATLIAVAVGWFIASQPTERETRRSLRDEREAAIPMPDDPITVTATSP